MNTCFNIHTHIHTHTHGLKAIKLALWFHGVFQDRHHYVPGTETSRKKRRQQGCWHAALLARSSGKAQVPLLALRDGFLLSQLRLHTQSATSWSLAGRSLSRCIGIATSIHMNQAFFVTVQVKKTGHDKCFRSSCCILHLQCQRSPCLTQVCWWSEWSREWCVSMLALMPGHWGLMGRTCQKKTPMTSCPWADHQSLLTHQTETEPSVHLATTQKTLATT